MKKERELTVQNKNRQVQDLAEQITERLKGKMIIHRYDAMTTSSIYFKFDYGVANSLRISDHEGYGYLSYRYNIIIGLKRPYAESVGQYVKEYYPETMISQVADRIIAMRKEKIQRYQDYEHVVEKRKVAPDTTKSFWKKCKEIK